MFNKVAGLNPKRHFFNKSFVYKTTMQFAELVPFLAEEVVPGDKYKIGNNAVVRVSPMVAPILDNIYLRTEYFFVPERLLASDDKDFQNFITGGIDGSYTTYPFGLLDSSQESGDRFDGSISDYLGLPSNWFQLSEGSKGRVDISDKFHRAYIKVWNEFYRDENLQEEVSMLNISYFMHPLKRAWRKDYFTSALLTPQRGTAPAVPIQGVLPVSSYSPFMPLRFGGVASSQPSISSLAGSVQAFARMHFTDGDVSGYGTVGQNALTAETGGQYYYSMQDKVAGEQSLTLERSSDDSSIIRAREQIVNFNEAEPFVRLAESSGIGFDAADVRKLMQIQKFMERNMRAGVRLNEFLLAHFGVSPRDEILQRPRFLGSTKSPIIISEVLQTSESTSRSPQGRLSGKGLGLSAGMIGTHTFEEPGIILGLASIVPDLSYDSQGINKKFTRFTKYDYYFPEFAHLTEQPIKKYELFYDDSVQTTNKNNDTFGYQGIYDDMRHNRDMVTGMFRTVTRSGVSMDFWHLARSFDASPALNSDFITCNPSMRIFEVQDEPPFQVCIGNVLKAIRPMPAIAEPGLVDHF